MVQQKHGRGRRSTWMRRHLEDPYVKKANAEGWRSRAIYKLKEIDEKDQLIKPGMQVVDLGAAPGSWSQYVTRKLNGKGRIVALDVLPIDSLPGVEFIRGDFTQQAICRRLKDVLGKEKCDLVISDMIPNMSGMKAVDQPKSIYLVELAMELALEVLHPKGAFLAKVLQGEGLDALMASAKKQFRSVYCRKPRASRPQSREFYLVGRGVRQVR